MNILVSVLYLISGNSVGHACTVISECGNNMECAGINGSSVCVCSDNFIPASGGRCGK